MTLSPTLEPTLRCPRRYTLEKVSREPVAAPFAASVLGRVVHERIASSLRRKKLADTSAFRLPKRVLLREEDDLESLLWRAAQSLKFFNERCRPWLNGHDILAIEQFSTWLIDMGSSRTRREGQAIRFVGKLDLVLRTASGPLIVDWKTGGLSGCEDQLRFYLALWQQETGEAASAQAISLSRETTAEIGWDEEVTGWVLGRIERMIGQLVRIEQNPDRAEPGQHCVYCPLCSDLL